MINQIKTIILLSSLATLFIGVGNLIGGTSGMLIALVCALVINGVTYFFSDRLVLRMYQAQPLDKKNYASLYAITDNLARTMNIPMPSLWLIKTPMANAFATGRSPEHASVAVTTGILDILDKDELTGVLAHELAHVKNRDTLIATIAATCAAALSYLAHLAYYIPLYRTSSNNKKNSTNPLVYLIIIFVTPLAATLIQLALSRTREFEADRVGACSCHNPRALARALEKIHLNVAQRAVSPAQESDPLRASTAPLFIINPLTTRAWITTLFSTHPPLNERIARLYALIQENKS